MRVKELKEKLKNAPDDAHIQIGIYPPDSPLCVYDELDKVQVFETAIVDGNYVYLTNKKTWEPDEIDSYEE